MNTKKLSIVLFLFIVSFTSIQAQSNPVEKGLAAITKEAVQGQLEFLSSDWMEGREATTKGEFMAADYIASMFKVYGIKPAGDFAMPAFSGRRTASPQRGQRPQFQPSRTYYQNINFIETEPGSGEQLFALTEKEGNTEKRIYFTYGTDFSLQASPVGVEYTAPLVFVGYGFKNDDIKYDDFKGIDVKGKIIVRISGIPGASDPNSEIYKKLDLGNMQTRQALNRSKNEIAQKLGAIGVIELPSTLAASQAGNFRGRGGQMGQPTNIPFRYNLPYYEGETRLQGNQHRLSLPVDTLQLGMNTFTVSPKVSHEILKNSGIDIAEFEKNVNAKMKPASREIKGKSIYIKTSVKSKIVQGRNVLGMIEGENPNEVVVVGGHYDHLGAYQGYIWNGADDNGSGTIGMLTIAKAVAATGVKPKKTIIFAAWTGEEKGLFGSQYFVSKFAPIENIKLNLNYDMISRNVPTDTAGVQVGIQYSEKYPALKEVVEKANKDYNIGLELSFRPSVRPTGGSDFQSFAMKDIPVYGFMAAMHEDYHQPTDTVDKVDINKMTNIIKVGFLAIWNFANDTKLEKVN